MRSRGNARGGGNVSRAWPHTRRSACCAPRGRCAATTCVHGRERDSWPHGSRRRSTRLAHIEIPARAHSIPDDRNRPAEVFLLRDHARARRRAPRVALLVSHSLRRPSVRVAAVPLRHAAGVLPCRCAVSAAAWPPAIGATSSDIPVLGSSVGCTAAPEISDRSLCAGKFAISATGLWHAHRFRWYPECVPWEVMTPLGPPGEDDVILLGHFALDPLSLSRTVSRAPPN